MESASVPHYSTLEDLDDLKPASIAGTLSYRTAHIFGPGLRAVGGNVAGAGRAACWVLPHTDKVSQEISNSVLQVPQCLALSTDLPECKKHGCCFPYPLPNVKQISPVDNSIAIQTLTSWS